jgi:hypothetical protein
MARRKESRYRFDASEKKIKIPDNIKTDDILLVNNATRGIIIANQLDAGKGFTISYNPPPVTDPDFIYAIDGFTEITLDYDTSGMLDTDELNIYIEDERHGLKARPYDFGTDAIERIRVANPQSLIDADFEYGLQNTKWQSIGLNRNIPSFFEFPGPALVATDITSGGTATYSTMTVTVASGAPAAGTPISVSGTTNTLAEGLFVVLTSNNSTSFTYLAKGSIASGSIFTPYSVVKKGGVYAGSPMQVASMSGDGAGGIVTINFTFPHGLVPGSPIYVFDSTAGTQAHEGSFYVKQVVDADTVTYDAAQTVTNGTITTATISVYAKNDSFFTHRPFDGGVLMGPAIPIHGMEAKRQTKRYFRYQSGKGVFFSTGTAFCPIFDIESATYSSPDITITTQVPHAVQKGAVVNIYGINSANYNGEYSVKEIVSSTTFKVEAIVAPTDATAVLTDQPRVAVTKWIGSSIRCGLFDDTNGMFWEYDGQKLYVVRRSSTFQLAGTINVTAASELVTGTNTRFTEQLRVGDYLQIRGSRHIITTIISDTSLSISPEIRGASASNIKPTIIRELRIPQEKFNMDRINGIDSPAGFKINLAKMQMVGIQYSWYGAGFIDFMLRGPLGEFITVHRIPNSNINDEAFMRSGNLPSRYEVVNESAISSLASTSGTSGNLELVDADRFPTPSATNPAIVMLTSNQSGTVYHELVSYTGKSGNTLTGTTRATDYTVFLDGANRTFKGSDTAYDHPSRSSVILLNNTCAPTISHWGSAVIMDGGFDDDDGYLFNLARSGTVNGSTTTTVLLFRAAPSVSDTIPGLLGEREVLNRSQIKLQELEISNNATRNIEIAAVLNPSNLGTITWSNANTTTVGSAQVFQPSFAQFNTTFTTVPVDGEILFRFLSTSGTSRFDLTKIKEVQNSIVGGNNTYPDGPEVIAFIIQNNNNQSATYDLSLKWIEAQA